MTKKNIKKIVCILFFSGFALLFCCILFASLFFNKYNNSNQFLVITVSIIYIAFGYFLYNILKKINNTRLYVSILLVIFIIIQFLFAYIFVVEPSWDFGTIYETAINNALGNEKINSNLYFYAHPNNIGATILLSLYYKLFALFNITNWNTLGIILNIIFIDIGIIYIYKLLKLYYPKEKINFFFFIILLFSPFITYVPIFYTDTLSLPFGISGIYYYFLYEQKKDKKIFLFISGLLLGLGYFIKSSIIIIFVAIIIYNFVKSKKERLLHILLKLLIMTIGVLIPLLTLKIYININFDKEVLDELKFPSTHYIMMGLKNTGGYNANDQAYTGKFKGIENKEKENIKIIKIRLKTMWANHTLLKFYTNKIVYTWGDGTFFAPKKLERVPKNEYKIKDLIIDNGNNSNIIYQLISQSKLIIILSFIIFGCIFRRYLEQEKQDLQLLLYISIVGIFLLLLFWETRSRYLMNFTPLILMSAILGIDATIKYIERKRKEKAYEIKKEKKYERKNNTSIKFI